MVEISLEACLVPENWTNFPEIVTNSTKTVTNFLAIVTNVPKRATNFLKTVEEFLQLVTNFFDCILLQDLQIILGFAAQPPTRAFIWWVEEWPKSKKITNSRQKWP